MLIDSDNKKLSLKEFLKILPKSSLDLSIKGKTVFTRGIRRFRVNKKLRAKTIFEKIFSGSKL